MVVEDEAMKHCRLFWEIAREEHFSAPGQLAELLGQGNFCGGVESDFYARIGAASDFHNDGLG